MINVDSTSYQKIISLGHNCFNYPSTSTQDSLCNGWAARGDCWSTKSIFEGGPIPEGTTDITDKSYMEERCNKACNYCSGKLRKSWGIPILGSMISKLHKLHFSALHYYLRVDKEGAHILQSRQLCRKRFVLECIWCTRSMQIRS